MKDFNFLPGVERPRSEWRSDSFPTIAREALKSATTEGRAPFPFESWATANRFEYPEHALAFLSCCESAAEVYLAREVARHPGACGSDGTDGSVPSVMVFEGDPDLSVHLQVRAAASRVDMVAYLAAGRFKLAIEVDGIGFHHRAAEQIASDYLRERRLVAAGFTVIRFTAQEVFSTPAECWRQVGAILSSRRR